MAFLGRPVLNLGTPSRPSPTSPGTVNVQVTVPLFVDRIERCFVSLCPDVVHDPMYQINVEIWSADRNEPPLTTPLPLRDQRQFDWMWSSNNSRYRRVAAGELANAHAVSGAPSLFELDVFDSHNVSESSLNEDWGPFPPPGVPPAAYTRDELFARVYLATVFSSWQVIQTIDSAVVTGQFFGP